MINKTKYGISDISMVISNSYIFFVQNKHYLGSFERRRCEDSESVITKLQIIKTKKLYESKNSFPEQCGHRQCPMNADIRIFRFFRDVRIVLNVPIHWTFNVLIHAKFDVPIHVTFSF